MSLMIQMMTKVDYVIVHPRKPKEISIDPNKADDPFYRYKMPQMQVQTIGNGKMIRTQMGNVDDVAKSLHVPSPYIPHFFAYEQGAKPIYDSKKSVRERGSISGEYTADVLGELLKKFIKGFVLCPTCTLPELVYCVVKKGVEANCHGCGSKTPILKMQLNAKFKNYVTNHPPPPETNIRKGGSKEKEKEKEKEKKPEEDNKDSGEDENSDSNEEEPQEAVGMEPANIDGIDLNAEADAANENLGKRSNNHNDDDDDDDWAVDTSEQASKQRLHDQMTGKIAELVLNEQTPVNKVVNALSDIVKSSNDSKELATEVQKQIKTANLDESNVGTVIYKVFVEGPINEGAKKVKANAKIIGRFIGNSAAAQKSFLQAMEADYSSLLEKGQNDAQVFKAAMGNLKSFYDTNIVDEENIIAWHKNTGQAQLKNGVARFVTWLEEAEEESE